MRTVIKTLLKPFSKASAMFTGKNLANAAIVTGLGVAIKAVGSGFRAFVDFHDAPQDTKLAAIRREGTLLTMIGAATFISQLSLGPLFKSIKNLDETHWLRQSRMGEKIREMVKSKTGKNVLRTTMLIPVYVGAEILSRHIGHIDFGKFFNPNNTIAKNPLAYSPDSFISSEAHISSDALHQPSPKFSHSFQSQHRPAAFSRVTPYQLSFSRQANPFRV